MIARVLVLLVIVACSKVVAPTPSEQTYSCAMHPEVQTHTAGVCPKCGMALMLRANASDPTRVRVSSSMVQRLKIPSMQLRPSVGDATQIVGTVLNGGPSGVVLPEQPKALVGQETVAVFARAFPKQLMVGTVSQSHVLFRDFGNQLKPGMIVDIKVPGSAGPLLIPESAPLFAGGRSLVYVVHSPHQGEVEYEARTVVLGPKQNGNYPVVSGLVAGEHIVVSGAFVVDSELQMQGGMSLIRLTETRDEVIAVPAAQAALLRRLLEAYVTISAALAHGNVAVSKASAAVILQMSAELSRGPLFQHWQRSAPALDVNARLLLAATDLAPAREAFGGLSSQMLLLLSLYGNQTLGILRVIHCPMAFNNAGASWAQAEEEIANPYFGEAMLHCGSKKASVEPRAYLSKTEL